MTLPPIPPGAASLEQVATALQPFVLRVAGDAHLTLAGFVDSFVADDFGRELARTPLADRGSGPVLVSVSDLEFIDHRGMLALEEWAESVGRDVVLDPPLGIHGFLVDALGLQRVRAGEDS